MTNPRDSATSPSFWAPLRAPVFRALWFANLGSFVGTWFHEVAAAWLMTSLAPRPLMVSAVQAAATLPMFMLVLPAGALADVADRRRLLLVSQAWMLLAAGGLAALAWFDAVTPIVLLLFTALLATGAALAAPAWQSILPELVERDQLAGAVALGSLSINVARSVGPALGGFVVATAGSGVAFLLNAASFAGIFWVLKRWRRPKQGGDLPAERFFGALRTGVRYVRHAPRMRTILIRIGAFAFSGSALWALLPLLARIDLGLDALRYGALLGAFGLGAVGSATQLARLRRRLDADTLVLIATLVFAASLAAVAALPTAWAVGGAMLLAGIAWMLLLSTFQVAAQTVLPAWVRGRALSSYLLVFFGSMALGSLVWGAAATFAGVRAALALAAGGVALTVVLRPQFPLRGGEDLNLAPSRHWPAPIATPDIQANQGPVLVTLEYQVDPSGEPEFREAMERLRRARQRDGAYFWDLFRDTEHPGRYVEAYLADSWLEHMRQHERITEEDRRSEARASEFLVTDHQVQVRHLVSVTHKRR